MDKFSDSRLKRMKHYGFPFFYKSAKTAIADYNKEIQNGKMSFSRAILILYPKKNQESKNLVALYQKALIFRNNKRLRKRSFELVLENLLATALILIPLLVPLLSFDCYLAWWKYILIYILTFIFAVLFGFVLVPCLNFLTNFKVKIGKLFTGFFKFILLFSVCLSAYFFLGLEDGVLKGSIFATYALSYSIILFSILNYIMELLVDARYFSIKITLTDELIIESAYRLSKTNWSESIRRRSQRQNTIEEIERLSCLIEKDWSSHIIACDERTSQWKEETLKGIASGLRKYKRQLIIPSLTTPDELKLVFKAVFEKILKHDIQGLIDAEVPAGRIKKKSKYANLQSVLVAILPLSIMLVIKTYFPDLVEQNIIHIGIALSGIWLLLSVLLWLDPNLADKIATIRSLRDVMKGEDSE